MWALFCLTACQPERQARKALMDEFLTQILVEVPVVSHQWESTPRVYSVIDLKVLENSEQWFWNRQKVEVTSIVDGDIFEAIQDGKSVVLRGWASPEVRYGKVGGLIKPALQAGVSQVDLVMKNEIGVFGALKVDLPMGKGQQEWMPILFSVDDKGWILMKNESGMQEYLFGNALFQRLQRHRSVADLSSVKSRVFLRGSGDLSYGEFVEVLMKIREAIEIVHLMDLEEDENLDPLLDRALIPSEIRRKPAPPNGPTLPKYVPAD